MNPQVGGGSAKVSVIIPTYESADSLQACLQSLREHGSTLEEIIVVDGFSGDGTPEVALKAGAKLLFTKGSQARARNIGVRRSSGDYILFMDSDQTLGAGTVQECLELCTTKNVQAIKIPEIFRGDSFWSSCSAYWRNHVNLVGGGQVGIPRFYMRECLLEAGLFNEELRLWEDCDLYQRVKAIGAKTAWCQSIIYHHEPSSVKAMLAKSLQYGRSVPVYLESTRELKTPMSRITPLTMKSVLKSFVKLPLLATGCLILSAIKGFAMFMGIIQRLLLNLFQKPPNPSPKQRQLP